MDLLKNFVYAGVGLAANTTDKVKETIEDLVEKGKISDTEGRKIVDDFFKSTTEKRDDMESKWKKLQSDLTERFDFLKKDDGINVVDDLKKEIEELKAKLKKAEAEAKKTATATAKKTTAAAKKTATAAKAKATTAAKKTTAAAKKATTRKPAAKKTTAAKTTK